MKQKLLILKAGGAQVKAGPALENLVQTIRALDAEAQLIVVHGGGSEIADMQRRLGLEARFVEGLRVTDADSLQVAEMILSGTVNKRLTAALVQAGVRAVGLSGVDGGFLRAAKLEHEKGDLGRVGQVYRVDTEGFRALLDLGFTPVISPISLGNDGAPFNVNADHVAVALASAMEADELAFVTDVPAVLDGKGQPIVELSAESAQALIEEGTVSAGMIPKVRSALEATASGVALARIADRQGLIHGGGTCFVRS